jgi:hypothetical protein
VRDFRYTYLFLLHYPYFFTAVCSSLKINIKPSGLGLSFRIFSLYLSLSLWSYLLPRRHTRQYNKQQGLSSSLVTMPPPQHPPTPASSTEIKGKDGSQFSSLMSFELPPPATQGMESQPSSASSVKSSSASSYHPTSPTSPAIGEAVKIRRRSSAAQAPAKDAFALPPPPTRSRKIIQMKPRGQAEEIPEEVSESSKSATTRAAAPASKKKQPSSTSVAGRKIARKTAHSLIERRRRSKMNEEFGVLKDMIPACTGEMHKLAILQVSSPSFLSKKKAIHRTID